MEQPPPFDLNAALVVWRAELRKAALPEEEVAELESHLSESMTDLRAEGLPAAAAFAEARQRLGAPAELAAEFGKLPALQPMPVGLRVAACFFLLIGASGWWTTLASFWTGRVAVEVMLVLSFVGAGLLARRPWARPAALVAVWGQIALLVWAVAARGFLPPESYVLRWGLFGFGGEFRAAEYATTVLPLCALGVVLGVWLHRTLWGSEVQRLFERRHGGRNGETIFP